MRESERDRGRERERARVRENERDREREREKGREKDRASMVTGWIHAPPTVGAVFLQLIYVVTFFLCVSLLLLSCPSHNVLPLAGAERERERERDRERDRE